jgi:hypothetical protein
MAQGGATTLAALRRHRESKSKADPGTARHVASSPAHGRAGGSRGRCFDAQASACAEYLKAGREVAIDGRLLFDEFQTQDGSYASRVSVVAERVEFLASRNRSTGQANAESSPTEPAAVGGEAHGDSAA